jgi:hypothetical protein
MMLLALGVVLCLVAEAAIICALMVLAAAATWRRLAKLGEAAIHPRPRYTPEQLAAVREVVERWRATQARIEAAYHQPDMRES